MVKKVVNKFIQCEEKNFSLFQYANDLRSEVEKKQEEIYKLTEELKQAKKKKQQAETDFENEQKKL